MITINSTNIISNYTCSNFTVPTFQVQSGDVIASCIHASGNASLRLGVVGKANSAITLRRLKFWQLWIKNSRSIPNFF